MAKTALDLIKSGLKILEVRSSKKIPIDLDVASTAISEIGFNPATSTLRVTFLESGTYAYFGVDLETFNEFISAGSIGSFFNEQVKGSYIYFRI